MYSGKRLTLESKKKGTSSQPSPGSTIHHLSGSNQHSCLTVGLTSLSSLLDCRLCGKAVLSRCGLWGCPRPRLSSLTGVLTSHLGRCRPGKGPSRWTYASQSHIFPSAKLFSGPKLRIHKPHCPQGPRRSYKERRGGPQGWGQWGGVALRLPGAHALSTGVTPSQQERVTIFGMPAQ